MKTLTIGRNPESGIVVSEAFPRVSNNHATIELVNGVLVYNDHSSNGTVINGNLVKQAQVTLTNGDQIMLAGDYLLAWPVLLNFFPDLQRRTLRFDANSAAGFAAAGTSANPAGQPVSQQGTVEAERKTRAWRPGMDQPGGGTQRQSPPHGGTMRENFGNPQFTGREMPPVGGTDRQGYNPGMGSSSEAGQLNSLTQSEVDEQLRNFNLGAFLGSWVWALANRIYWPMIIIPLSLIPYVGQVLSLFLCTYLGLNGNPLGWRNSRGLAFPVWLKAQKTWIYIGAVIFIICACIQFVAFAWITNMF